MMTEKKKIIEIKIVVSQCQFCAAHWVRNNWAGKLSGEKEAKFENQSFSSSSCWVCILKDFDRCDCQIYESVAKMPPFKRKMILLIGAIGVGREALLKRLIKEVYIY